MMPSRIMSIRPSMTWRYCPTGREGDNGRHCRHTAPFSPIRFLPRDKPGLSDSLLVCFGALAVSQATGILADTGTVITAKGTAEKL